MLHGSQHLRNFGFEFMDIGKPHSHSYSSVCDYNVMGRHLESRA
jgi:hypothetical protein